MFRGFSSPAKQKKVGLVLILRAKQWIDAKSHKTLCRHLLLLCLNSMFIYNALLNLEAADACDTVYDKNVSKVGGLKA